MTQRIISRADWRPAELEQSGRWLRILTDRERADLRAGLDGLKASRRPMLEITRADVPLGAFAAVLAEAEAEMESGIGFLVLRGLPMDGQDVE